jgi:periplasmic mercuric ion binding protein
MPCFLKIKNKNMKFLQLTFLAIFSFALTATAQQKVTGKAVIKVPGLHCDLDKDRIERSLFKAYGIGSVKAEVKKKTVTVTWLTDRTNIEEIKTAIANAGYDADDVTAEESAQKRLPAGCKVVPVVTPVPIPVPVKKDDVLVPASGVQLTKNAEVVPAKKITPVKVGAKKK